MSTINQKEIIFEILTQDGHYEDDPRVMSVWSYKNIFGKLTQKVFYDNGDLYESHYVHDPKLLWNDEIGLTEDGKDWIRNYVASGEKD